MKQASDNKTINIWQTKIQIQKYAESVFLNVIIGSYFLYSSMNKIILLLFLFQWLVHVLPGQDLKPKEKYGLYGFFDHGKMILDFQYDSIREKSKGGYFVKKEGKWGLISPVGNEIIPCQYDVIETELWHRFLVWKDGFVGLLDSTGAVILEPKYDAIDHVEKDTLIKYQGKWCLYNSGMYIYNEDLFVFTRPETIALFPGCDPDNITYAEYKSCSEEKMYKFIFNKLNYPEKAIRQRIFGQVILRFIINEEGQIIDPVVVRGIGGGCDESAIEVVRKMPIWKPARQDGKIVAMKFTLPIKFVLK